MDPETDEYIRESIENSLGLPISDKNLRLKLLASEDARHRLQDQIFVLEEILKEADKRVEQYKVPVLSSFVASSCSWISRVWFYGEGFFFFFHVSRRRRP